MAAVSCKPCIVSFIIQIATLLLHYSHTNAILKLFEGGWSKDGTLGGHGIHVFSELGHLPDTGRGWEEPPVTCCFNYSFIFPNIYIYIYFFFLKEVL